ncbi:unnamed protein product [Urochloa humidicola]
MSEPISKRRRPVAPEAAGGGSMIPDEVVNRCGCVGNITILFFSANNNITIVNSNVFSLYIC